MIVATLMTLVTLMPVMALECIYPICLIGQFRRLLVRLAMHFIVVIVLLSGVEKTIPQNNSVVWTVS